MNYSSSAQIVKPFDQRSLPLGGCGPVLNTPPLSSVISSVISKISDSLNIRFRFLINFQRLDAGSFFTISRKGITYE